MRRSAVARFALASLLLVALFLAGCLDGGIIIRQTLPYYFNFPRSATIERDVVYATRSTGELRMDIYKPLLAVSPSPLVVLIHGGSWQFGSKSDVLEFAYDFAANGITAAAIDYRLVGNGGEFPAPIVDVLDAIDYLKAHASEEGIDPDRVALWGASAGAHLALMAGLATDFSEFDPQRPPGRAYEVRAVVNVVGPTSFSVDATNVPDYLEEAVERFLGGHGEATAELARQASPILYVRADGPPVLTIHGTSDGIVPLSEAELMHAAMDDVGELNVLVTVPDMGHNDSLVWYTLQAQFYRPYVLGFLSVQLF